MAISLNIIHVIMDSMLISTYALFAKDISDFKGVVERIKELEAS